MQALNPDRDPPQKSHVRPPRSEPFARVVDAPHLEVSSYVTENCAFNFPVDSFSWFVIMWGFGVWICNTLLGLSVTHDGLLFV